MLRFLLTGPWQLTVRVFRRAAQGGLRLAADEYTRRLAERTRDHLVNGIKNSQFTLAPRVSGSSRRPVLIDTSTYVSSIQVHKDEKGYRVGFADGAKEPSGAATARVANHLEFGTSKMHARPHWRPTKAWAEKQVGITGRLILGAVRKRG